MRSLMLLAVLIPGLAMAQKQALPDAPPPPDIDDPGVTAVESRSELPANEEVPIASRSAMRPSEAEAPEVTIRTRPNGDVVEEYRVNGRLSYVRVTPQRGLPYTLRDTNNDGRLDSRDTDAPVHPVYYTLYEWN